MSRSDLREMAMADGLTDEALLRGDLNAVERLVYSNETRVWVNLKGAVQRVAHAYYDTLRNHKT